MLILTRKLGEAIRIGDNIRITVSDIKGKQIRIGIEAPDDLLVHREEVYTMIQEQNMKALQYAVEADQRLPDLWNKLVKHKEDGE